jgi:hypothetical protein
VTKEPGVSLELQCGADVGPETVDAELRELSRLLTQIGLAAESLTPETSPPPNTRGVSSDALGTLLIQIGTSSAALTAAVRVMVSWLKGKEKRSVKLKSGKDELELTGQGGRAQEALIEAWLSRRGAHDEESLDRRN